MKKIPIIIIMVSFLFVSFPASSAEKEGQKGANSTAYDKASDQAIFNRVGDWFATLGKNEEEKAQILRKRKLKRDAKQLEKEVKKAKKQAIEIKNTTDKDKAK